MSATVRNLRPVPRVVDWADDTDINGDDDTRTIAIHLTGTRFGINVAVAWLLDDRAPQAVRDVGDDWRQQIRGAR